MKAMESDGVVMVVNNVPLGLFSEDSMALTVFGGIPKNGRFKLNIEFSNTNSHILSEA